MAKPEKGAGSDPGKVSSGPGSARKAWAGEHDAPVDAMAEQFTASIGFDQRLADVDIRGSLAHAEMLGHCGIISQEDAASLRRGLENLRAAVARGEIEWDLSAEDIHMNVERKLYERIGEVAGRLHTARSRNDQVATDTRLWLRDQIDATLMEICALQQTLIQLAEEHLDAILPGYTHTQHAQPVLLAHHLLAYFWMLDRDRERLMECRTRVNTLPLGSGALAGTPHPIDRHFVAERLGFNRVAENSMDAVSDRDFAIEAVFGASMVMTHLSRLCGELVLWQSREFSFIMMDDSMTTGSSIMPQKKNPDVAELTRGKAGRVYGDLMALLTVMKALPLTYNSDMQEDKERLFDAVDTERVCLRVVNQLLRTTRFRTEKMENAIRGDFSTATDLADWLTARCGLPFREAHGVVRDLVRLVEQTGKTLEELRSEDLQTVSLLLDDDALHRIQPRASVAARVSFGGTAPDLVTGQLDLAKERLEQSWQSLPGRPEYSGR
ncbi:MAG TPA: argininosuccinate lyase [Armatimonadota bacterium]|nr:argininosuccinate lyase [Armatimonadota bacterium]